MSILLLINLCQSCTCFTHLSILPFSVLICHHFFHPQIYVGGNITLKITVLSSPTIFTCVNSKSGVVLFQEFYTQNTYGIVYVSVSLFIEKVFIEHIMMK